ncbi:hypothetical protein M3Y94_00918700 [Aphelenchoides besseyi]|nr:hypothetical protein M3Y94_00918700 [Aphelenchoides besseyi]KAI6223208.1 hypothetical protein M3Y95_00865000 [Aphelenchoides besseyi]
MSEKLRNLLDYFNARKRRPSEALVLSDVKKLRITTSTNLKSLPTELVWTILDKLDLQSIRNFSLTCHSNARVVASFRPFTLKYQWLNSQFATSKSILDIKAVVKNLKLEFGTEPKDIAKHIKWLEQLPIECPNLPLPLLLEQFFLYSSESNAVRIYVQLLDHWMRVDVHEFCTGSAFPIRANSSSEDVELEKRLRQKFAYVYSENLESKTQSFVLSVLLRSLCDLRKCYKLIYTFFGCRNSLGYIPYGIYEVQHAGSGPDFDRIPSAFICLMQSTQFSREIAFTPRMIFMLVEDLTTSPVLFSMHSFVRLLMSDHRLCVLSISVRFLEGFEEDAAAVFYYCVRSQPRRGVLYALVSRIMQDMPREVASRFYDCALIKSQSVLSAVHPENEARLRQAQAVHKRLNEILDFGFQIHNPTSVRQRASSSD